MVGQEKLINTIKAYSVETFPHTLLLLGEAGCGKKLLVSEVIAPHLQLDVVNITESISLDTLLDIELRAVPAIYLINMTNISDKQQNVLLKLLEEPTNNSYLILTSDNKTNLLDTIINRCVSYSFEPYSEEQLEGFILDTQAESKNLLLKVCSTPGQIKELSESKLEQLYELCVKMSQRLSTAQFPNTLSIAQKINYKDDYDKFNIISFFNVLMLVLYEDYQINNNILSSKLYYKVREFNNKLQNLKLNREMLVENMLIALWKIARE